MADTLGTRIMKLRGEKETQQQLADALGVSRSLVKAWENGDRPVTSDHLVKLASHYGVSCDYLLGLIGEDNATNDEKLRMVSEYTGLSNEALEMLSAPKEEPYIRSIRNTELNKLLSAPNIRAVLRQLGHLNSLAEDMEYEFSERIDDNGEHYYDLDELIPTHAEFRLARFEAIDAFSTLLEYLYNVSEIEKKFEDAISD